MTPAATQPNLVSALARAHDTGQPVKIESATTETSESFATPDGRIQQRISAGQVRYRSNGSWKAIDFTLQRRPDGSVAPIAEPAGIRLSGARDTAAGPLAAIGAGATELILGWPGPLPEPQLSGNRAVYHDALPGVDVVVEVTSSGVRQLVTIESAAAARQVADITLPLTGARASTISADGDGHWRIAGPGVATTAAPIMWDDQRSGAQTRPARSVGLRGSTTAPEARISTASADATLAVHLDQTWLASPQTVYPVTLDTQADSLLNDSEGLSSTSVQDGVDIDRSNSAGMFFGAQWPSSPYETARAFTTWDTTALRGREIVSASAHFNSYLAATCDPVPWEIWTVNPYNLSIRWPTQPRWLYKDGTSTETKGGSTCASGWVSVDAGSFFQRAALSNQTRSYMGIRASSETDPSQAKYFYNSNDTDPGNWPYADVTYAVTPTTEDEWADEPAVPATDGSDVPQDDGDLWSASDNEDPEATGDRTASGAQQDTFETFEELAADAQPQDTESGDESGVSASTAACTTSGEYQTCLAPGTADGLRHTEATNPGSINRSLQVLRPGYPVEDGSQGDLNVEPMYSAAASTIPKPKQFPDVCYDRARSWNFAWLRSRFSACRGIPWDLTFYYVRNGTVTVLGTVQFWEFSYLYTKRNSRTWVNQTSISVYNRIGDTAGLRIAPDRSARCSTNCKVNWRMAAPFLSEGTRVDGVATIRSNVARGKTSTMTGTWTYRLTMTGSNYTYPNVIASPSVRCDQKLKGYPNSVGCVVPSVVPTLTYSRTGAYPELARHIFDAQNSGLPGKYPSGTPLTRLTNNGSIDANRRKSCPSTLRRPSGKTCDEYPFASSFQGASTGGGNARTFSGCGITGTPTGTKGATGYSRCMINGTQNSKGGRALSTFFSQNRILYKDQYRVRIS